MSAEAVAAGQAVGDVGDVDLEAQGAAEGGDGADELNGGGRLGVLRVIHGDLVVAVEGVAERGPVLACGRSVVEPA